METREAGSEACERLAAAIADGRFLEDPPLWREHVAACAVCRARVEGLFELRGRLEAASLEAPARTGTAGPASIEKAFERFHRGRRNRGIATCVAVVALAGGGAFLALRAPAAPAPDAMTYAKSLLVAVEGSGPDEGYARLKKDAALRAEFERALEHPASVVRQVAIMGLLNAQVEVPPARIEEALTTWAPTLDEPVTIASASDDGRWVTNALAERRASMVKYVLSGLHGSTLPGEPKVRASVLTPFLTHSQDAIRQTAASALSRDPGYRPGPEMLALVRGDASVEVRHAAATCVLRRLGSEGASQLVRHWQQHPDEEVEDRLAFLLGAYPDGVALARSRLADARTPRALALRYAHALHRAGDKQQPDRLIEAELAQPTPAGLFRLAWLAAEADWSEHRAALQEAWRRIGPESGREAGEMLASWDAKGADEKRLHWALDIGEAARSPALRVVATRLAGNAIPSVAGRAKTLLRDWPEKK